MKITLIFLLIACFVGTEVLSNPVLKSEEELSDSLDHVKEIVDKIIQKITDRINALNDKLKEIIANVLTKISSLVEKAKADLNSKIEKLEKQIEELKSKGEHFKKCAEQYEPEIENVKNETESEINECKQKAVEQINNYQKEIEDDVQQIQDMNENLRVEILSCVHLNPFKTAKCLHEKSHNYMERVKEILATVADTVKNVGINAAHLVDDVSKCSSEAVSKAKTEVKNIESDLENCYKNKP